MKDLSHLKEAASSGGWLPDAQPRYAPQLAQAWADQLGDQDKAMATAEARMRHSWADMCARRLGYEVRGDAVTQPLTVADYWRFGTGTTIHEKWQDVMMKTFPHAEVEVTCQIDSIPSAGHIDLVLREYVMRPELDEPRSHVTAMELKTINGYGFKMAVGARGEAEGPRGSAITQAALNGYAIDADEIVIVYLSLENLSPRELTKVGKEEWQRFSAEWSMTKEEYWPIAEKEIRRFSKILEVVDEGALPPRAIPDLPFGARVVAPTKGTWNQFDDGGAVVGAGTTWHCGYCPFQSRCEEDGLHGDG